jgi:hypothetical protein
MNWSVGRRARRAYEVYRKWREITENGLTLARRTEINRLLAQDRYTCGQRLAAWGYKIYSQHHEDGMLAEIFRRIGCRSKYFVECGVGDGLENNTLALLMQDWKGVWIEGNPQYCDRIRQGMPRTIGSGQLILQQAFITSESIDNLIDAAHPPGEIDLLSIDIDGNDYHVWRRIKRVEPRVIVMEYNPKFPPPIEYCMEYNAAHMWDYTDQCGASLSFLEREFRERGYSLVACDITGTNAIFVRSDETPGCFSGPFTAEFHYEPPRFELGSVPSGHPPSYRTVETRMRLHSAEEASFAPSRNEARHL